MTTTMHFPQADFLAWLERSRGEDAIKSHTQLPPVLERLLLSRGDAATWASAADSLITLLTARKATLQAAFDTALVADELRRFQKYAKPGRPSAHIVQLRQKQAAARQATNITRQSLIKAAAAFVRDAGIDVPERQALDAFIIEWIDTNVPKHEG